MPRKKQPKSRNKSQPGVFISNLIKPTSVTSKDIVSTKSNLNEKCEIEEPPASLDLSLSNYQETVILRTVLELALANILCANPNQGSSDKPGAMAPPLESQGSGFSKLISPVQDLGRTLLGFLVGSNQQSPARPSTTQRAENKTPPRSSSKRDSIVSTSSTGCRQRPHGHPANPSTHSTPVLVRRPFSRSLESSDSITEAVVEGAESKPQPQANLRKKKKSKACDKDCPTDQAKSLVKQPSVSENNPSDKDTLDNLDKKPPLPARAEAKPAGSKKRNRSSSSRRKRQAKKNRDKINDTCDASVVSANNVGKAAANENPSASQTSLKDASEKNIEIPEKEESIVACVIQDSGVIEKVVLRKKDLSSNDRSSVISDIFHTPRNSFVVSADTDPVIRLETESNNQAANACDKKLHDSCENLPTKLFTKEIPCETFELDNAPLEEETLHTIIQYENTKDVSPYNHSSENPSVPVSDIEYCVESERPERITAPHLCSVSLVAPPSAGEEAFSAPLRSNIRPIVNIGLPELRQAAPDSGCDIFQGEDGVTRGHAGVTPGSNGANSVCDTQFKSNPGTEREEVVCDKPAVCADTAKDKDLSNQSDCEVNKKSSDSVEQSSHSVDVLPIQSLCEPCADKKAGETKLEIPPPPPPPPPGFLTQNIKVQKLVTRADRLKEEFSEQTSKKKKPPSREQVLLSQIEGLDASFASFLKTQLNIKTDSKDSNTCTTERRKVRRKKAESESSDSPKAEAVIGSPVDQNKALLEQEKPSIDQENPSIDKDQKPAKDQVNPSIYQVKPSVDQVKPSIDQEKQENTLDQENPSLDQENPSLDQENPSLKQENSALDQKKISVDQASLSREQSRTSVDQKPPLVDRKTALDQDTTVVDQNREFVDLDKVLVETPMKDKFLLDEDKQLDLLKLDQSKVSTFCQHLGEPSSAGQTTETLASEGEDKDSMSSSVTPIQENIQCSTDNVDATNNNISSDNTCDPADLATASPTKCPAQDPTDGDEMGGNQSSEDPHLSDTFSDDLPPEHTQPNLCKSDSGYSGSSPKQPRKKELTIEEAKRLYSRRLGPEPPRPPGEVKRSRVQSEGTDYSDYSDTESELSETGDGVTRRARETRSFNSRRSSTDSSEDLVPNNLRELKTDLRELEDKFKKAMVANASLDNEKCQLMFQVDLLKDQVEEVEEQSSLILKELRAKTHDFQLLTRDHAESTRSVQLLQSALEEQQSMLVERGLVLLGGGEGEEDEEVGEDEQERRTRAIVSQETANILSGLGPGPLDVRIKRLARERDDLQDMNRRLKLDLEEEKNLSSSARGANAQQEIERETKKILDEYKFKISKSEQENATLQATVARLESQVVRFKTASETAELSEESLKAERRKNQRELRDLQTKNEELETANKHLDKRLEKLKTAKSNLLQQL